MSKSKYSYQSIFGPGAPYRAMQEISVGRSEKRDNEWSARTVDDEERYGFTTRDEAAEWLTERFIAVLQRGVRS